MAASLPTESDCNEAGLGPGEECLRVNVADLNSKSARLLRHGLR